MIHPEDQPLIEALATINGGYRRIGIAVSGGSDSLALLHLAHLAAGRTGWQVFAITIDHALRPEARQEALDVGKLCQTLGIPHSIATWAHDGAIAGNVLEAASKARAELIAPWAQGLALDAVMLAHTSNDQAEALLMGLARGAGLDGLCGMRPLWQSHGITWSRPLLAHSRQTLRDHLIRHGLTWVDDPSNTNDKYSRARARKALSLLADFGIAADSIAQSVQALGQSRAALQALVARFAKDHVVSHYGLLDLPLDALLALEPDLQRRFLRAVLIWMGGTRHAPRNAQLQELALRLSQCRDATLAGVRFRHRPKGLRLSREPRAIDTTPRRVSEVWDHRWHLETKACGQILALGKQGLAMIPDWRDTGIPREALLVSPAIWQGDRLIAAPLLGFGENCRAELCMDLVSFLHSH